MTSGEQHPPQCSSDGRAGGCSVTSIAQQSCPPWSAMLSRGTRGNRGLVAPSTTHEPLSAPRLARLTRQWAGPPQDSPAPRDGAEELGGPVFSTLTPELGGNYLVKTAWDLIFTWGLLFPDDWTLSSHLSWAPLRGSLKCDSRKSSRGSLQNELGWHLRFEPPTRACLFLTPRVLCPSWLLCQPYRSRTVDPKISFCWNSMELGVILVLLSYDFSNPDLWPGEAACVLLWRRSLVMDAGR